MFEQAFCVLLAVLGLSAVPTTGATTLPTSLPTLQPDDEPSGQPTLEPTAVPSHEYTRRGILSASGDFSETVSPSFARKQRRRLLALPTATTLTYAGTYGTNGIPDGTTANTEIADIAADTGDATSFTLGGTDAASFVVDNDNKKLSTNGQIDYANGASVTFTIYATKMTTTTPDTVTITVLPPIPTSTIPTMKARLADGIPDATASGIKIAVLSDEVSPLALAGTDADSFSIENESADHSEEITFAATGCFIH